MTPRAKALVAGWFSFQGGHATAGDFLARDVACEWLERAGFSWDIATATPFRGGVDWHDADPASYTHVVFVCGPFAEREWEREFLGRFAGCHLIGLNLSMLDSLEVWNPFDLLFERDSSRRVEPDVTFLSRVARVPVVGVCLVEPYPDSLVAAANDAVRRLLASRELAAVPIDTRLDVNATGLRSPAEVESLIARMDAVVTTRLHGTVLALKNGVPPLAIDPMGDGAKILRQAERLGWPVAFAANDLKDEALRAALDYCLSEAGREKARECRERAMERVRGLRTEFVSALEGARVDPTRRSG